MGHMAGGSATPAGRLTQEIASILRAQRARLQVSVRELTAPLEISDAQLRRYFKGERAMTTEDLDRLCRALDLDIRDVIADADAGAGGRHLWAAKAVGSADVPGEESDVSA